MGTQTLHSETLKGQVLTLVLLAIIPLLGAWGVVIAIQKVPQVFSGASPVAAGHNGEQPPPLPRELPPHRP